MTTTLKIGDEITSSTALDDLPEDAVVHSEHKFFQRGMNSSWGQAAWQQFGTAETLYSDQVIGRAFKYTVTVVWLPEVL
ncbi:hypothetical protein [Leifsonia sp. Leaf264]|uniref:hypothetical protein n=1 Tax=Leifsonia sp. Leaf264 TaxID=1736314 RepID=UPI0006FE9499|nr:hypothetical protein [Leifsonia sp. Leaf264]KQO98428.1 hypothetical protein ASF30_10225 [Leifsonia sp. Leaf264]